ncbi:MAG: hypothetical protein ABIG44_16440 [Planctomycetota bacterium]
MPLMAECPVCRQPLRWTYIFRTLWSRWHCAHCGSLLRINMARRLLAVFPMVAVIMAISMTLSRIGGTNATTVPLMAILIILLFPLYFLLVDRAVVIERAGFRCQGCGYDLQGQVVPRCPECGRELDEQERAFLERGVPPPPVKTSGRRGTIILIICIVIFLGTLVIVGFTHYYAQQARMARQATTQAVTQPGHLAD